MRRQDIFHICIQNLLRKKTRTILTISGVLIGCCSIIIMVSLGIGMKESQEKLLSELGDLTIITVNAPQGGKAKAPLDDSLVETLNDLPGVDAVTPKLTLDINSVTLSTGAEKRYVNDWAYIVGLDTSAMEKMGYHFLAGTPAEASEDPVNAVIGEHFAYNFKDTTRPEGNNMVDRFDGLWDEDSNQIQTPSPYFDPLSQTYTLEIQTDAGTFSTELHPAGMVKEDYSKGTETSDGIMVSLRDLRRLLGQNPAVESKPIPYDCILVKVSSINQVAGVERQIKAMGYSTESLESVRKPMEQEAQQKQMMFGSLGAISLFVAALGIANTMVMSISERAREIGIMKSFGCYIRDIRILFLAEAGSIGFIGGLLGSILSVITSVCINLIALGPSPDHIIPALLGGPDITRVSVIPPWLLIFAIAFSVLIGLGSGFYPANKAVRISALEAIKMV